MKDVKELKLMTLDDVLSQIKDGMTPVSYTHL